MRPRWWLAIGIGALAGLPIGWILSYAAALPFFLGSFFFALLGLVLGAIVFRLAAPAAPIPPFQVWLGTVLLIAFVFGLTLVKESHDFPIEMAEVAADQTRELGGCSLQQFKAEMSQAISDFLRRRYPPGGTFGYMRWIVTSGVIRKSDVPLLSKDLRRTQGKGWWVGRVLLSASLLTFGVASQTMGLRNFVRVQVSKSADTEYGGASAMKQTLRERDDEPKRHVQV